MLSIAGEAILQLEPVELGDGLHKCQSKAGGAAFASGVEAVEQAGGVKCFLSAVAYCHCPLMYCNTYAATVGSVQEGILY